MYFPGSTLEQIDSLRRRVDALESKDIFVDSLAKLAPSAGLAGSETFRYVSGGSTGQLSAGPYTGAPFTSTPAHETLKKKGGPSFSVSFKEVAKANATVEADRFYFDAGFVVFSKQPSIIDGGGTVAAYPVHEISSVTKL